MLCVDGVGTLFLDCGLRGLMTCTWGLSSRSLHVSLERRPRSQNMRGGMKKQKLDKEKDRDISEKIALGMHKGSGAKGGADL